MLTQNEISTLSLSPTKKDFVQIWNELLEVSGRLSERWDPTSTNESDPGIVILKAIAGIADKLNYNIDKNTLEAFMPTAAQEDSMRKLCDMLGYNIKYYQSATAKVTIKWYNTNPDDDEKRLMESGTLTIPKFMSITNADNDINYFVIDEDNKYISAASPSVTVSCIEGQLVKCQGINDNNVITNNQISEHNRYYLPETQIAENGIFVYNVKTSGNTLVDGEKWLPITNLNIQPRGSRVFKFGYDSYRSCPYIEFPEDYSELFNEGLFIYYTRTNGVNGSVSPRTLTQIELPTTDDWQSVSASSFSAENPVASVPGSNPETIKQAYNGFKKTVGTFETLVTCRDYMNKLYSLINGDTNKPYVSNILVTDIRSDLNRAAIICSCDDAGIFYKDTPLVITESVLDNKSARKPVFIDGKWKISDLPDLDLDTVKQWFIQDNCDAFDATVNGIVSELDGFFAITQNNRTFKTRLSSVAEKEAVSHFDLVFYPFKLYNQVKPTTKDIAKAYNSSFEYSKDAFNALNTQMSNHEQKTIAHNIVAPRIGDMLSINNYLRLTAKITTNAKVSSKEAETIVLNIKAALSNAFNLRELDFGEEIPFESILDVIEQADPRIRVVSMNEPTLYTTFSVLEPTTVTATSADANIKVTEYAVASSTSKEEWENWEKSEYVEKFSNTAYEALTVEDKKYLYGANKPEEELKSLFLKEYITKAKECYNRLIVRNILAGRVPLFDYNTVFKVSFSECPYFSVDSVEAAEIPDELSEKLTNVDSSVLANGVLYADGDTVYQVSRPDASAGYNCIKHSPITELPMVDSNTDITELSTTFKVALNQDVAIGETVIDSEVKLAQGEQIRFRAPNFITKMTYPAYVNYKLKLDQAGDKDAVPAEAMSLYDYLNFAAPAAYGWEKLYGSDEFKDKQRTLKLSLPVTITPAIADPDTNTSIVIENTIYPGQDLSINEILYRSGCIRFESQGAAPTITGDLPSAINGIADDLKVTLKQKYIVSPSTIDEIKNYVTDAINTFVDSKKDDITKTATFNVEYTLSYIPFDNDTLGSWKTFVTSLANKDDHGFKFTPVDDGAGNYLFRASPVAGQQAGKLVTESGTKLLTFYSSYFGNLPSERLRGIYLLKELGSDKVAKEIPMESEYQLKSGEKLYFEYTPSSTTEDGTTQQLASVQKVYGEGTIIRPKGFQSNLLDSDVYASTHSRSSSKTVDFTVDGVAVPEDMYTLGANESIEIRDFSKTILNADFSKFIYLYKNFDCTALEDPLAECREHTLKEGEYIFYTDAAKAEFAYFSNGTKVSLTGPIVIKKFSNVVDISEVLENGPQVLEWDRQSLDNGSSIEFQEYQYITLGEDDSLIELNLGERKNQLDNDWCLCAGAAYQLSGEDAPRTLPKINCTGATWEVCSALVLEASPSSGQILRNTGVTETTLTANNNDELKISINRGEALYFKPNLSCFSTDGNIAIDDLSEELNPDKLTSFNIKLYTKVSPRVVYTEPGSVMPHLLLPESSSTDTNTAVTTSSALKWDVADVITKDRLAHWHQVTLENLRVNAGRSGDADKAAQLYVSLLPNTYGIFCIYIDYEDSYDSNEMATWIATLPGAQNSVELLNAPTETEVGSNFYENRTKLNPGINIVRVNTMSPIFIKASANAKGSLLFDELQLVNITASRPNGLDLDKLGYVLIDNTTVSGFLRTADKKYVRDSNQVMLRPAASASGITEQKAHDTLLEEQLLAEISAIDRTRSFYYNVPIESSKEIELNISADASSNTLGSSAAHYNINNVNNNFVVSKLDIGYIDKGISVARSSLLN